MLPSSAAQTTGARLVVDALLTHGVERVFCVPGESFLAVLDSLHDETERIQTIVCRHEAAAANMAEAVGKLTGRPGVAIVTRGPGATHASIGVHTAFQDSTPMILLIGQCAREHLDREAFQEIDYRRMFGQMAKWVAQIDDPAPHSRISEPCVSYGDVGTAGAGRAVVAGRCVERRMRGGAGRARLSACGGVAVGGADGRSLRDCWKARSGRW